jgi:hypothetical protein
MALSLSREDSNSKESTARQNVLVDRVLELGWPFLVANLAGDWGFSWVPHGLAIVATS